MLSGINNYTLLKKDKWFRITRQNNVDFLKHDATRRERPGLASPFLTWTGVNVARLSIRDGNLT